MVQTVKSIRPLLPAIWDAASLSKAAMHSISSCPVKKTRMSPGPSSTCTLNQSQFACSLAPNKTNSWEQMQKYCLTQRITVMIMVATNKY